MEIGEDPSDFKLKYDPTDPDANEEGYVELPNVDLVKVAHQLNLLLGHVDAVAVHTGGLVAGYADLGGGGADGLPHRGQGDWRST